MKIYVHAVKTYLHATGNRYPAKATRQTLLSRSLVLYLLLSLLDLPCIHLKPCKASCVDLLSHHCRVCNTPRLHWLRSTRNYDKSQYMASGQAFKFADNCLKTQHTPCCCCCTDPCKQHTLASNDIQANSDSATFVKCTLFVGHLELAELQHLQCHMFARVACQDCSSEHLLLQDTALVQNKHILNIITSMQNNGKTYLEKRTCLLSVHCTSAHFSESGAHLLQTVSQLCTTTL